MSEVRKAAERTAFRFFATVVILVAVISLTPMIWDKLSPFIIAVPLAALLQPMISFFQKKLKIKKTLASAILVILGLGLLIGILIWLLSMGAEQLTLVMEHSGDIVNDVIRSLRQAVDNVINSALDISPDVEKWIRTAMNDAAANITQWGTSAAAAAVSYSVALVASLPYSVIYLSFLAMGLFFIARNYDEIRSYLPGGKRRKQNTNAAQLTRSAVKSLAGYLRVQCTFALITLVLSWIYLKCFSFPYSGLLALLAGVMEMIPMIGSGLLYIVLGVVALLAGNTSMGFQLLGLTGGLQLLRRLLEPKLMSDSIGISPLLSLIGMFVGMRFGGILGLIGGPVLMAVLVGAARGGLFNATIRDWHTLTDYFRKRWATAEENGGAEQKEEGK